MTKLLRTSVLHIIRSEGTYFLYSNSFVIFINPENEVFTQSRIVYPTKIGLNFDIAIFTIQKNYLNYTKFVLKSGWKD